MSRDSGGSSVAHIEPAGKVSRPPTRSGSAGPTSKPHIICLSDPETAAQGGAWGRRGRREISLAAYEQPRPAATAGILPIGPPWWPSVANGRGGKQKQHGETRRRRASNLFPLRSSCRSPRFSLTRFYLRMGSDLCDFPQYPALSCSPSH